MSSIRVAAIQMNSHDDVAANLVTAANILDRAADGGAVLAVLPENFAGMGRDESYRVGIAESDGIGPIQDFLRASASRNGMWIVGGTVPLQSDNPQRPFASCLVFDDQGRRVARYDKIHLFDVAIPGSQESYRESAHTTPGHEPLLIDTPWGGLGIAVCYDLRFPEMIRFQSAKRMDILAIPAAFTFADRRTWGHSMIIDPWGKKLDVLDDGVDSVSSAVDLDQLSNIRKKFPALSHRRMRVSP
jgi:nitrilase